MDPKPIIHSQILNPRGFHIEFIPSPNHSSRHRTPEVILVHATVSDKILGTLAWFQNPHSKVSADFVIGKDGRIVRMVSKGQKAWHAGICLFKGTPRGDYNDLSYGVELVNLNNGSDPYPEIQLQALAYVAAHIQFESPSVRLLRRHADVAIPAGRKSDPLGLTGEAIYTACAEYQPHLLLE